MTRSRKDAIIAGIKVSETKHQMKRRSPWHDYRKQGIYMLTLVVEGRKPLLGRLVGRPGEKPPGTGPDPEPWVELTALGKTIRDEEIRKIGEHYQMVEVWKLCIMPDHLHMIVCVKEDMPEGKNLGQVVWGFKVGCTKAWRGSVPGGSSPVPGGSGSVPGGSSPGNKSLFEKGYNDKILQHKGQLDNWKCYLDDNPRRLAIKQQYPDLFKVVTDAFLIDTNCQTQSACQLVGNRFLFDIPQKMAVVVHSAYSDKEYDDWRRKWLACGEAGGVLVSAAIATREKTVIREAMDMGYSIVLLRENGFPPLYKPAGEAFDACSRGQLLQLSPWQYHMQRKTISRELCLQLNRLAEGIADGTITISR